MGHYTKHLTLNQRLDYYIDKTPVGPMGCYLWTGARSGKKSHQYGLVWDGEKQIKAHRAVWRRYNPGKPMPPVVRHRCDVTMCCRRGHLLGGTQKSNVRDMFRRKRRVIARGIGNPNGALTDAQVEAILRDPRRQIDIAKDYECGQSTVSRIKRLVRTSVGYAGIAAECAE